MPTTDSPDLQVTRIAREDYDALLAFLRTVPRGEHTFFKEDVHDPEVVVAWVEAEVGRIFVARLGVEVVGVVAVVPGLGWSSHVGDLRLVVDQEHRGQGVGGALARRALTEAIEIGLRKVTVLVLADQTSVVGLFQNLGFVAEALLCDHIQDEEGALHDLLMLAHPVPETNSGFAVMGLDEVVGASR